MDIQYDEVLGYVNDFRKRYSVREHDVIDDIYNIVDNSFIILKFPNKMGLSGLFMRKKDREIKYNCIYINTLEPRGRQNFTFAHELFHVYYKESKKGICLDTDREVDEIEKQAEMFASNLLIPRFTLLLDFREWDFKPQKEITENHIFSLQFKYKVSFQAIIYAISDLQKHEIYKPYEQYVPNIPGYLYKYCNKSNWEKLDRKSREYNPRFIWNSVEPIFEIPESFRKNLISNFHKGLVEYEELVDIFSFFNIENDFKKYL